MTLPIAIILGIAIIIGIIIAAKKHPNRDEVLADLITEQVRKEPLPATMNREHIPFEKGTPKNVFDIAWKLYEEKPDTNAFVELDAEVGACQIIMEYDTGVPQIMLLYVFSSEEPPEEVSTLRNDGEFHPSLTYIGNGLYPSFHPYPEGKESVEEEICRVLHITTDDVVKYIVWDEDNESETADEERK